MKGYFSNHLRCQPNRLEWNDFKHSQLKTLSLSLSLSFSLSHSLSFSHSLTILFDAFSVATLSLFFLFFQRQPLTRPFPTSSLTVFYSVALFLPFSRLLHRHYYIEVVFVSFITRPSPSFLSHHPLFVALSLSVKLLRTTLSYTIASFELAHVGV